MNIPNTTLITSFYNTIENTSTQLLSSIDKLLQQNIYMIIYIDNSLFEIIKEKRNSYGFDHITNYNVIEFEQLPYYYLLDTITESQLLKITQLFFCLNSINTNPFNTDKFAWFNSNNFEKCNYTDNILQYIFNNISNNFHIQVQNVISKNIICDDFYTFGKQIGIKIINKLIQNFENTKPGADDFNIIEIIDEYYNDYKLSYGDYQNIFENFIQITSNFDYIYNFIIRKYLNLKYHKEGYNCCKFILNNPKLDTCKPYYFNILFSYFVFSYYYNPKESLLIYKKVYKNSLINPQYLTNQSFYDTQLDFVKLHKNKSYKIIINVFACPTIEKYKNEILKINETFYKDAVNNNIKIIYFFGKEKVPDFVNTNDNDPTYVYLDNVNNDYMSASYKQERGLQYIFENYSFDYVLTIGTDTFVHIKNLLEYLKTLNPTDLSYIGGHSDYRKINSDLILHYHSGAGFILTYNLLSKLYPTLFNMTNNWINICNTNNMTYLIVSCDVAISYYIHKINNFKMIYCDNIYACNYMGLSRNIKCIYNNTYCSTKPKNIILCHYMSPDDFDNFYNLIHITKTIVLLITDKNYFNKAKETIRDLRTITAGNYSGDLGIITIDFNLNPIFKQFYNIIEIKIDNIDKTTYLKKVGKGFGTYNDGREINKINQWEKLNAFDNYFKQWDRVFYIDSGARVLNDIKYFFDLDYKNKILVPEADKTRVLNTAIITNPDFQHYIDKFTNDFGPEIINCATFLNCIFIYDTQLLNYIHKSEMIDIMNTYPIFKTNEMAVMAVIFEHKYKVYFPISDKAPNNKIYFDWSDINKNLNYTNYIILKYPVTIKSQDT